MKIQTFEEIISWQKSRILARDIYKMFSKNSDYGFKSQILRATVSISNNIAEGFERKSNREFRNYLFIAKGSTGEVRSMLYLAFDLAYIDLKSRTVEISKLISGLIKTL